MIGNTILNSARFLVPALLLLFNPLMAAGQQSVSTRPFFDAISFATPGMDSTRIDLYLAVPYSGITFKRTDNVFSGKYQAHITIKDSETRYDSTFTRTVRTSNYDFSNGKQPAFEVYQQRVLLPPGTYTASVEILDLESNFVTNAKRDVTAIDFARYPFALSGLMLVSKIREDATGHTITPLLTENVSLLDDHYFLFFEVYNNTEDRDFVTTATYQLKNGDSVKQETFSKEFPIGRSQQWLRLPTTGIARGSYVIELRVAPAYNPGKTLAASQRNVRIEGTSEGMPLSTDEIDEKIDQLRYVASQEEIDFIGDGESFTEKRDRYAEFWNRKDPSPGTPRNEAMQEYFRRINYANDTYRSYAEGWLTDKGRVYVLYGQPDQTATDSFRADGKAVETWSYYNYNLRLVFVDESGFGDFRLRTPVPYSEKYRYGR